MKTEKDRYFLASEAVLIRFLRRILEKQALSPDDPSLNRSFFLAVNALLQKSQTDVSPSSAKINEHQDVYGRND